METLKNRSCVCDVCGDSASYYHEVSDTVYCEKCASNIKTVNYLGEVTCNNQTKEIQNEKIEAISRILETNLVAYRRSVCPISKKTSFTAMFAGGHSGVVEFYGEKPIIDRNHLNACVNHKLTEDLWEVTSKPYTYLTQWTGQEGNNTFTKIQAIKEIVEKGLKIAYKTDGTEAYAANKDGMLIIAYNGGTILTQEDGDAFLELLNKDLAAGYYKVKDYTDEGIIGATKEVCNVCELCKEDN